MYQARGGQEYAEADGNPVQPGVIFSGRFPARSKIQ